MSKFRSFKDLFVVVDNHEDYLVVNKSPGVLSQSAITEEQNVNDCIRSVYPRAHLMGRLDRPVSGLMIFSKKNAFNKHLLKTQEDGDFKKTYVAIVEGQLELNDTCIENFHQHHKKHRKAYIKSEFHAHYVPIKTQLNTIQVLDRYSVIEVQIDKAKFHQIRGVLAHLGHPIKGDVKYGARRANKARSIHLHCFRHSFPDLNMIPTQFEAALPKNDNLWGIIDIPESDG